MAYAGHVLRLVKKSRALNKSPFQSYQISLAMRDHIMLPATQHKWTHPALTPARQSGKYYDDTIMIMMIVALELGHLNIKG